MVWVIGQSENICRRWFRNGAEVTTGSATVRFKMTSGGVTRWLQTNNTFAASPIQTFPMTYVSGVGWSYFFTVPTAMSGFNVVAEAIHSDASLAPLPEEQYALVIGFGQNGAIVR